MLTATVSHEMRTPLNAILGMGRNISRLITNKQGQQFHRILMNSAQLLLFIVNDLLDLYRIKNGKFVKNEEEINIRNEFRDILDVF